MKATLQQEELARGLAVVSRAISTRTPLPALANILMTTDGDRLRLSATDLELSITCRVPAHIREQGSLAVPGKTILDLVNTFSKGSQVNLSADKGKQALRVEAGSSRTTVKGLDPAEFPPFPSIPGGGGVRIRAFDLRAALQQVVFAASDDQERPTLTGVFVQVNVERVMLCAADGFRLSVRTTPLDGAGERVSVILPARAMGELARILSLASDAEVTLLLPDGNKRAVFCLPDIELAAQSIEGRYPDVQQIIPNSWNTRAVLPTAAFLKACKQAEVFAREQDNLAVLNLDPANGSPGVVTVSGRSAETGDSQSVMDASVEGHPLRIAFNTHYLREALAVVKTAEVVLEVSDAASPAVIRALGDEGFLHVLMPMQEQA